jgi:hemerythrin-like domain-containing protein
MLVESTRLLQDFVGAAAELSLNQLGGRLLSRIAPVADRRLPVITLPGFMAPEASLAPLNQFLNRQGFNAQSWGLGRNVGPQDEGWGPHLERTTKRLARTVRRLADECSAPVSLVGHSLGGIYARELACRLQGDVDRVITLGTPTFHPYAENRHNRLVARIVGWSHRLSATEWGGATGLLHWYTDRPKLPCVAVHSPIDGFVHEGNCYIPDYIVAQSGEDAPRENVRVLATHIGMTFSPWVLLAIADRLLADRANWRPFDASRYLPRVIKRMVPVIYPSVEVASRARCKDDPEQRDSRSRVVDRLLDEHRDLDGLVRMLETRSSHRGPLRSADYYLLRDIVRYVHDYAERVHHPAENLLVRKVLLRNPGAKRLVERLQREHELASMETQKLLDRLDKVIKRPGTERARAVRKACVAFARHQRAHMRFENEKIFPSGISSLSSVDWRTIEARLFAAEDPLFGRVIAARHRVLYEYLLAHERKPHAALGERSARACTGRTRRRRNGLAAMAGA